MLSFTFALGSVHSFCCTSLLFIFTMNTSFTKLSVIAPKLHFEAIPFNSFQNCLSDSPSFCFLDRNLNLSNVSFFGFSKHSLQFFSKSVRFTVAIFVVGNLSAIVFLPAAPNSRYKTLIAFFIAGISSKSPIRLFSFAPVVFVSSDTEILFFAIKATSKRSIHFSHSNLGVFDASVQ